jgi:hypothetical protein
VRGKKYLKGKQASLHRYVSIDDLVDDPSKLSMQLVGDKGQDGSCQGLHGEDSIERRTYTLPSIQLWREDRPHAQDEGVA